METIKLFLVYDKEGKLTLVEVVNNSRIDAVMGCDDINHAAKNVRLYRDGVDSGLVIDRSNVPVHVNAHNRLYQKLLEKNGYTEIDEDTADEFSLIFARYKDDNAA